MGREAGHRGVEGPATGEPSEADRDLGAVLGWKQGGANDVGYDSRRRHAARGTEQASEAGEGGGGVVDVQLDEVTFKERMWRAGVTERCYDNKHYLC